VFDEQGGKNAGRLSSYHYRQFCASSRSLAAPRTGAGELINYYGANMELPNSKLTNSRGYSRAGVRRDKVPKHYLCARDLIPETVLMEETDPTYIFELHTIEQAGETLLHGKSY
jgi:hypothetical protein